MGSIECRACNFGVVPLKDGTDRRCWACKGTGWTLAEAEDFRKVEDAVVSVARGPGHVLHVKGKRYVVADWPHQKGLKLGEVAAWREGFDDPSPVVINESEVQV